MEEIATAKTNYFDKVKSNAKSRVTMENPICPKTSNDHKQLIELANEKGHDPLKLRKLLWLLNAPNKLHLITLIAKNLKPILANINQHPKVHEAVEYIDDWKDTTNFILSYRDEIKTKLGKHTVPPEKKVAGMLCTAKH